MSSTAQRIEKALSGLVVITVGVLVALWADAAWADRADRLREQEILRDLLEEFRENESRLRDDIETSRESLAAGEAWRDAMMGTAAVSTDSLASPTAASRAAPMATLRFPSP